MVAGGAGWRCRARMLSTSRVRARGAHDVGAAGAAVERLGAGRLDRLHSVLLNRREHLDELPVAVVVAREPGPQAAEGVGQLPALEGRAVAQCTRFALQDLHVMPGIAGDLAATVARSCARRHGKRECSATVSPSWRMTIRSA